MLTLVSLLIAWSPPPSPAGGTVPSPVATPPFVASVAFSVEPGPGAARLLVEALPAHPCSPTRRTCGLVAATVDPEEDDEEGAGGHHPRAGVPTDVLPPFPHADAGRTGPAPEAADFPRSASRLFVLRC